MNQERPNIYTITVYPPQDKRGPESWSRTYGWYSTLEKAVERTEKGGDLHECLYMFLVIEEVPEGIYSLATVSAWYTWDLVRNKWVQMENPPVWAENVCNHSIG